MGLFIHGVPFAMSGLNKSTPNDAVRLFQWDMIEELRFADVIFVLFVTGLINEKASEI
jgi:hypothetical protein